MTKQEKKIAEAYYTQYNIDLRTMVLVVHHYIDCGERQISKLTPEWIDKYYKKLVEEDKAMNEKGKVSLISPEFSCYLLKACLGLYQLEPSIRYKIIKEWLR